MVFEVLQRRRNDSEAINTSNIYRSPTDHGNENHLQENRLQ